MKDDAKLFQNTDMIFTCLIIDLSCLPMGNTESKENFIVGGTIAATFTETE